MDRAENIIIQISVIPQEFIIAYNIKDKAHNGYIFAQVNKGMYGIPQIWLIIHDAIVKYLSLYVYYPSNNTSVICTHDSQPINFTLVFNDFGVKYSVK